MTIPHIAYAGAVSSDTDFVVNTTYKDRLLADARVVRWFAARDEDVTLSGTDPTKVVSMIDRKGGGDGSALTTDATRPVLAVTTGYGGKKALQFTDAADRSIALPTVNLTGVYSIVALVMRSAADSEVIFNQTDGSNQIILQGTSSTSFQHWRGTAGVNIAGGNSPPDTTPRLVIGSWDGTLVKGALGRLGAVVTAAPAGTVPSANSTAKLGRANSTGTPSYWSGSIAQFLICNVDILDAGNTDLRTLICNYINAYYGLTV